MLSILKVTISMYIEVKILSRKFTSIIVPAAGNGSRMKADINKQLLELSGKPVIVHTIMALDESKLFDEIIIVAKESEIEIFRRLFTKYKIYSTLKFALGGLNRQESVYNGLNKISDKSEYVAVHDGARPFVDYELLKRVVSESYEKGAVITAVPSVDTIKKVNDENVIAETLERDNLWNTQTPQIFKREYIENGYKKAIEDKYVGTDDSSLVERIGVKVYPVMGCYNNIKITTKKDLKLGEIILSEEY